MNRSRMAFVLIVGAAIVVVLGGLLANQLGQEDSKQTTDETPVSPQSSRITIAVSPLVEDWIQEAAQAYNSQRRRVNGQLVELTVVVQDGLQVWTSAGVWTAANHPLLWIPEMGQAVEYANQNGLQFTLLDPSLASTVLAWGTTADRAQVLTQQFTTLDWNAVQQASVTSSWSALGGPAEWGPYFKPGFAPPDRYTSGMAALLVAAAEFHSQPLLDAAALNDPALTNWLKPVFQSIPNIANLGANPAENIAARGTSIADVALLPESEWLVNYPSLKAKLGSLTLAYPAYQVWFDFPVALWDGPETTDQDRAAAQDVVDFLSSADQLRQAAQYGLRQPDGIPAASTLFDQAGALPGAPTGEIIQLPTNRSDLIPFVNRNWNAF
jgi:hypothetical protein